MTENSPIDRQLAKIDKLSELVQETEKAFQHLDEISDKIAQKWQSRRQAKEITQQ